MDLPDKSGQSVRTQLLSVKKRTGKIPKLLVEEIKIPSLFLPLYNSFLEMKSQDIESRVSHHALINYQILFDVKFLKFEIEYIKYLDIIFDEILNKRKK